MLVDDAAFMRMMIKILQAEWVIAEIVEGLKTGKKHAFYAAESGFDSLWILHALLWTVLEGPGS